MIFPAPLVAFLLIVVVGALGWWALRELTLPKLAHKVAYIVLTVVLILALVIYVLLPMLGGVVVVR